MPFCLRVLMIHCLCCGICLPLTGQDSGRDLEHGLALVTTVTDSVIFKSPDGNERQAELHAIESLSRLEVFSKKDDYLFLSLSNGSALGLYKNSHARFESYLQRPFNPDKEVLEYEPSLSKLVIRLSKGSITFSAERLNPLSVILVNLPTGQVEIRNASGRIMYDDEVAQIAITSGIVAYNSPATEEPVFINAPNQVRIRERDSGPPQISAAAATADKPTELTELLVNATHRSRERVIFKLPSQTAASIPRPILVAKPATLLKRGPRPYRYLD